MRLWPRMIGLIMLVMLGAAGASLPSHAAGSSWALLIGIDDYEDASIPKLDVCVSDATKMRQQLQRLNIPADHLILMTSDLMKDSPLRPSRRNAIAQLERLADRVQPDDSLLIYFSGHGFTREGHSYLTTVDTDRASVPTLETTSLPLELLREKLKAITAERVVFFIDACRDTVTKGDDDTRLNSDFAKRLVVVANATNNGRVSGTAVLFACSENEWAFTDPVAKQSVFTRFLLQGLRGKAADAVTHEVTVNRLGEFVYEKVRQWAKHNGKKQTPDLEQQGAKIVLATDVDPRGYVEIDQAQFKQNLTALLKEAYQDFEGIKGPLQESDASYSRYKSSLLLPGAEDGAVWRWKDDNPDVRYHYPTHTEQEDGEADYAAIVKAVQGSLSGDWKTAEFAEGKNFLRRFEAKEGDGGGNKVEVTLQKDSFGYEARITIYGSTPEKSLIMEDDNVEWNRSGNPPVVRYEITYKNTGSRVLDCQCSIVCVKTPRNGEGDGRADRAVDQKSHKFKLLPGEKYVAHGTLRWAADDEFKPALHYWTGIDDKDSSALMHVRYADNK